jgi:hypothetical protein
VLHSSEATPGQPRQFRWVALAVTLVTLGLAACGGGDSGESSARGGQEIVIKERANLQGIQDVGDVLDGSSIGGSPFCSGGSFSGGHGSLPFPQIDRTFKCPEGTLRIAFTPGEPQGKTVTGRWKVLSGTGAYEGLEGSGQMETEFETDTRARETFTGTVVP